MANTMRDEALVTLRAAELAASEVEEQVNAFTERIDGLSPQAAELDDRCAATHRRLLRTMNGSAAALIRCRSVRRQDLGPCSSRPDADVLSRWSTSPRFVAQWDSLRRWRVWC